MMKFSELPYQRPNIDSLKSQFAELRSAFQNADSAVEQIAVITRWNTLRTSIKTNASIAHVHYTQNVKDEAARAEKQFLDDELPTVAEWIFDFEKAMITSPFRAEFEQEFGSHFLNLLELGVRIFSPENKQSTIEISHLSQQYTDILASGEIEVDGKIYNLSGIEKLCSSPDRSLRKRAQQAKFSFLEKNSEELDRIYDELVKLRHKQAVTLGFNNYIELRYAQMSRTDYTPADVANFREQVRETLVPIVSEFRALQAQRLGVESLYFHDEKMQFPNGNPTPKGTPEWIVSQAQEMYRELSAETGEFFDLMIESELMDLVTRPNKAGGGYCTTFSSYGLPFIFSNFNGTEHDVTVLTHEAGHAFQAYCSRHFAVPEYSSPTMEACEIHSMSMEFITWKWMKNFFLEDADHFQFQHLQAALIFLPYSCAVDEFQHWVFENVSASPAERKAAWKSMEEKYLPWRKYDEIPYGEIGGMWQFQAHIYKSPFYYIDYALAETCALQFWKRSQDDLTSAFADYLKVCKVGGSTSFLSIVKTGNLTSPFEPGCLQSVVSSAVEWLETHKELAN